MDLMQRLNFFSSQDFGSVSGNDTRDMVITVLKEDLMKARESKPSKVILFPKPPAINTIPGLQNIIEEWLEDEGFGSGYLNRIGASKRLLNKLTEGAKGE